MVPLLDLVWQLAYTNIMNLELSLSVYTKFTLHATAQIKLISKELKPLIKLLNHIRQKESTHLKIKRTQELTILLLRSKVLSSKTL